MRSTVFMIEEVLKNVKDAEKRADEIIAAAEEQAANIRLAADRSGSEIVEKAKREARACSAITLKNTEQKAAAAFEAAAEACKKDCEKLSKDMEKRVEELGEEVFGRIIG